MEQELRINAEGKKKCERIMKEEFGLKDYMKQNTLCKVREIFKTRVHMQPFAGNYPNDRRFKKNNFMCKCKTKKEEESHLLSGECTVYGDLRRTYGDLSEDKQLVNFFSAVLERRERLEERTEDSLVAGDTTDSS